MLKHYVKPRKVATLSSSGRTIEVVLVPDISIAMQHMPIRIEAVGVPHQLLTHNGTPEQHDEALGLTRHHIRARIQRFLVKILKPHLIIFRTCTRERLF